MEPIKLYHARGKMEFLVRRLYIVRGKGDNKMSKYETLDICKMCVVKGGMEWLLNLYEKKVLQLPKC